MFLFLRSGIPFQGNYSEWLAQKTKRLQQEEKEASARQRTLSAELEWVQKNPKGQHSKSKARMERYEKLQSEDRSASENSRAPPTNIYIPPGENFQKNEPAMNLGTTSLLWKLGDSSFWGVGSRWEEMWGCSLR